MVARAWERADGRRLAGPTRTDGRTDGRGVEEMFVQNDAVGCCSLLNRRTRTMRVHPFPALVRTTRSVSSSCGSRSVSASRRLYTLVERDEVSTWLKLGFGEEANIPGFYKRSDAYILGSLVNDEALSAVPRMPTLDDEDIDEPVADVPSPAHERMEKTLATAKKLAKELQDRPLVSTKLTVAKEIDVRKAVEGHLRSGRALTAFEPFGRDVERRWVQLTGRGGFELVASTEAQSCFGNAFLELLTGPKTEAERLATFAALRTISATSSWPKESWSCFAMAPSDDIALATAFVANGFRRTGLVQSHLVVGGERKDAIVWSRKLANPTGE